MAIRLGFRHQQRRLLEQSLDAAGELSTHSVDIDRITDVRRAVDRLTPTQRTAVVLHYYRDLPVSEVAQALACKESTARVHLHQARQRLAELLIDYQ